MPLYPNLDIHNSLSYILKYTTAGAMLTIHGIIGSRASNKVNQWTSLEGSSYKLFEPAAAQLKSAFSEVAELCWLVCQ